MRSGEYYSWEEDDAVGKRLAAEFEEIKAAIDKKISEPQAEYSRIIHEKKERRYLLQLDQRFDDFLRRTNR